MPLVLSPCSTSATGPMSVECDGLAPDRLVGRTAVDVARMPVVVDGTTAEVGEVFKVVGTADDGLIICEGDFSRVHRLAAGMRRGAIEVRGPVGRHAGEEMAGGTLTVAGDAGDWLAAGMSGGTVHVFGNGGDNAAAALPGNRTGVRGGLIVIHGAVGCLAAARMRRGVLAVGGSCGEAAAFEMLAGTVIVAGSVGRRAGMGMRRGSLVALSDRPQVPPSFRRGSIWAPGILPLLAGRLAAAGFRPALTGPGPFGGVWQQWHGDLLAGGRGEIFHRPAG